MTENIVLKLVGLWFTLSVGSLVAATVNPSVSPAENTKLTPASSSLGPVYREARDYNAHDYGNGNGYRCISCLYSAMAGNQDRDRPGYPSHSYGGGSNGASGYGSQRENEDRNWYYQPDERNRYAQYENRYNQPQQNNRYDYQRPPAGYDRNDNRQNYQDYRGNGYDNRDPMYYNSMRGSNRGYGNRDNYESYYDDRMSNRGYSNSGGYYSNNNNMRPAYQNNGYEQNRYYGHGRPYERPERPERPDRNEYYDRNSYRGGNYNYGYDDATFRPWDQTYRGVSGFDSMGHGHYFANNPYSHNNPAQPPLPQQNPHQQAPPRPLQQPSHHGTSDHTHTQQTQSYDTDSLNHGNTANSNSGKGSYGGNWNYINSNDRNTVHHGQHGQHGQHGYGHTQDKDTQQSSTYGERPGHRPLSTSYLHERETPTVISEGASDANQSSNHDQDKNDAADTTDRISTNVTPKDETNTVSSSTTVNE